MTNLFEIAANDQSIIYLNQLFGAVGSILPATITATTVLGSMFKTLNTTALVLGALLVMHTIVMGLLKTASEGEFLGKQWNSLWVPVRTVMGVASLFPTSSGYSILQVILMWIIVQGIGAADTMWTTVLDYVSIFGSPYAGVSVSPGQQILSQMNFQNLFNGLVCQAEASETSPIQTPAKNPTPYYYCGDSAHGQEPFCKETGQDLLNITVSPDGTRQVTEPKNPTTGSPSGIIIYTLGPNGECGTMEYSDAQNFVDTTNNLGHVCANTDQASINECAGLTAAQSALPNIVSTMGALANTFANVDLAYLGFYYNPSPTPSSTPSWISSFCTAENITQERCCAYSGTGTGSSTTQCDVDDFPLPNSMASGAADYGNASTEAVQNLYWTYDLENIVGQPSNFIQTATNTYDTAVATAVANAMSQQPVQLSQSQTNAENVGWILAGSYYFTLAGMSNQNQKSTIPFFIVVAPPLPPTAVMYNYRNNMLAAGDLLAATTGSGSVINGITVSSTSDPHIAKLTSMMNSAATGITSGFASALTGSGTNPLSSLQSFGETLITTAVTVYSTAIGLSVLVLTLSDTNLLALGTGFSNNLFETSGAFLIASVWALIMAFCGFCISFGAMLGIYTPLIPYVIFTLAAVGWFIATVEAMVAAPFVALGILSPGGQHELLGRAEPAVMIMLNTFLRPTLMIFGMMAGMLLAPVVVTMINSGFGAAMGSINSNPGFVELIVFMAAYTMLIVTVMNKCFAMIYLVPDKVLTWIGGHHAQGSGGEAEGLGAVKGSAEGAAASTKGGMAGAGQSTKTAVGKRGDEANKSGGKGGGNDQDGAAS